MVQGISQLINACISRAKTCYTFRGGYFYKDNILLNIVTPIHWG